MLIACGACGAPNAPEFTWCQQCGRALAEPRARPRLPLAAAAGLVVAGLAVFAFIGNLVSASHPGGRIEVANVAVTVPPGWQTETGEPGSIVMAAGSGAGVMLLSTALPAASDAKTVATNMANNLGQGNPGATPCGEAAAMPVPGLPSAGWRVVECGVGDQSIAVLAATSADGRTAFVIAVSGFPENLGQIEAIFNERIGPTIEWKLAAAGS